MIRRFALVLVVAAAACISRTEGLDASKIPDDVRADYDLYAQRCSKCHSLARSLNAGITDDQQWVDYVTRMRRQPGSGISPEDQVHILRFLRYYAADLRRAKAERDAPPAPPTSPTPPPAPSPPPPPAPPAKGGPT